MTRFNPDVFRWARESAGLELEDAARAISTAGATLKAIEGGEKEPTRTQLSKMAKAYRRSLLTLYMPTPPKKGERGEDFRTVVAERTVEAEADVDALLRDFRARQGLVRSVLVDDDDVRPLDFIGSTKMEGGVGALSQSIEKLLGITRAEFRAQKDSVGAFNLLREQAEAAGIFVLLAGNLGSHHSTIPVAAFRGFAIADEIAPFIVINDGDAKAAWSFTLLHELAHLFLGATGVSGGLMPELKIEKFCNDVAGEFLLPLADIAQVEIAGLDIDGQIAVISKYAHAWRVSRQLVAYRLRMAGQLSLAEWKTLSAHIDLGWQKERQRDKDIAKMTKASGPSYYVVRRHRLGSAMLNFAHHAMNAGTLTPTKAAKVLGVQPRSVYPLLAHA